MNIEQTIVFFYHHQSNVQVEAYIKLMKCAIKKFLETNNDVKLALLLI